MVFRVSMVKQRRLKMRLKRTSKTSRKYIRLLVTLVAIIASTMTGASSRAKGEQGEWPCGSTQDLLSDQQRRPVWIGFEELKQHAVVTDYPVTPAPFRTTAKVALDVHIDAKGQVCCVRAGNGHPSLQLAAIQSAKEWTFMPFSAGGHPVSVFGRIEFEFGNKELARTP